MTEIVKPVNAWPVGAQIILLDAYMRNPIRVKITRHANADHVVTEDVRGVVYYAHHKRISGFADRFSKLDGIFA